MADNKGRKKKETKPLISLKDRRCQNCMTKAKANKKDSRDCPCGGSGSVNLGLLT